MSGRLLLLGAAMMAAGCTVPDVVFIPDAATEREDVDAGVDAPVARDAPEATSEGGEAASIGRSEALFGTLVDTMPLLAWYAEPDGRIPWYNRRSTCRTSSSASGRWTAPRHA